METSFGRGDQNGLEKSADQENETANGERTSRQLPVDGELGIEEGYVRLNQRVTNPEDTLGPAVEERLPVDFDHATAETEANVRERGGIIEEGTDPSGEPSKTALEQENARYGPNTALNCRSDIYTPLFALDDLLRNRSRTWSDQSLESEGHSAAGVSM